MEGVAVTLEESVLPEIAGMIPDMPVIPDAPKPAPVAAFAPVPSLVMQPLPRPVPVDIASLGSAIQEPTAKAPEPKPTLEPAPEPTPEPVEEPLLSPATAGNPDRMFVVFIPRFGNHILHEFDDPVAGFQCLQEFLRKIDTGDQPGSAYGFRGGTMVDTQAPKAVYEFTSGEDTIRIED